MSGREAAFDPNPPAGGVRLAEVRLRWTAEMLSKAESRERWRQIRALWNEWDPIGVTSGGPDDEYDAYLGPTLRLLEKGVSAEDLQRYLAQVTLEHMGLSDSPDAQVRRSQFATRLRDWYESKWPGSRV